MVEDFVPTEEAVIMIPTIVNKIMDMDRDIQDEGLNVGMLEVEMTQYQCKL